MLISNDRKHLVAVIVLKGADNYILGLREHLLSHRNDMGVI